MYIQTLLLVLSTDKKVKESTEKLRGYIGNKFKDSFFLHQHLDDNKLLYNYPNIQYKIIDGIPSILGIEEGVDTLNEISEQIEELVLGRATYKLKGKPIKVEKKQNFGMSENYINYQFIVPWIALNQRNYELYKNSSQSHKEKILEKIIVGNILSISKSLDYVVTEEIIAKTKLSPLPVYLKGIPVIGFEGEFQTNFLLPDHFGLGKSVSRGFGTVKRCSL
jgi:hypothetical protein